jgi:hypothetical protein
MFARSFRRTVLAAAVALTLLVPAAQADDWARQSPLPLDPALANAIGDNTTAASKPLPLDPALRNVLVEASSAAGATAPQATWRRPLQTGSPGATSPSAPLSPSRRCCCSRPWRPAHVRCARGGA